MIIETPILVMLGVLAIGATVWWVDSRTDAHHAGMARNSRQER